MCGIGGFWGIRATADEATAKLQTMARALQHRGPDDEGVFLDSSELLGLVHRRLSIIDLSPTGHQPMFSEDGRYVLTYNGEIYNFEQLRRELAADGRRFVGTSDTEVLLHAVSKWGIKRALERCVGMFALALWDQREHVLYLARDRLGEKPLCVARLQRGFAFASEFSALRRAGLVDPRIDTQSLALYLKHAYVPAPYGIYVDSHKVLPGQIMAVTRADAGQPTDLTGWKRERTHDGFLFYTTKYWDPETAVDIPKTTLDDREVQEQFDTLLREAVVLQRRADVPVGAFLSGGVDSSLVCSVAQSVAGEPIRTFTMGFDNPLFDESAYAAAVASHLGTRHTCVEVAAADVLKWVPKLARLADEPFADPSQLPTFLVSRIARAEVTVCLTGDGGDELFGGYNRYIEPTRIRRYVSKLPRPVARGVASTLKALPAESIDSLLERMPERFAKRLHVQSPGRKLHKAADVLTENDPRALYELLMSYWERPSELLRGAPPRLPELAGSDREWTWESFAENAMRWDIDHYLPDNNLAKVDRASMAVSLETRLPLLDHRIVELAIKTPLRMKIANGRGKLLLRNALARYLPRELIDRPKMGFSVPVAAWLRGPLREWAEEMLSAETTARVGFFDAQATRRCWDEHVSGRRDHYLKLWAVLQAHSWSLALGT
jgi:asparagine synthase (glutamine-hydrolysing)